MGDIREIFEILEKDARTTPQQIATMTGISLSKVKRTIKQAEEDGTIVKYRAMINWDNIEEEEVRALVEVKVQPQRDVGFDSVAERIYKFPQARSVYLMSGTYDLAVLVVARSMHEVADFTAERLAPIEGVQNTVTHFLLKRYKEDGEILASREESRRLPISP